MADKKVVRVLLEVTLEKDVPDLTDFIVARVWTMQDVSFCKAALYPDCLQDEEHARAD